MPGLFAETLSLVHAYSIADRLSACQIGVAGTRTVPATPSQLPVRTSLFKEAFNNASCGLPIIMWCKLFDEVVTVHTRKLFPRKG